MARLKGMTTEEYAEKTLLGNEKVFNTASLTQHVQAADGLLAQLSDGVDDLSSEVIRVRHACTDIPSVPVAVAIGVLPVLSGLAAPAPAFALPV